MNKENDQVVQLVEAWTAMSKEDPHLDLASFCKKWLANHAAPSLGPKAHGMMSLEARLSGLFGRLAKYATYYSKRALEPQEIRSIEDWVYLVKLLEMGSPTKSELIVEMVSEFPSGIDIIKRLIRQGWIEEYPDKQDRRSKRVRMTPAGRTLLFETFQRMEDVAQVAFQPLNHDEKVMLYQLLEKLDSFHHQTHPQVRQATHEETRTYFADLNAFSDLNNH